MIKRCFLGATVLALVFGLAACGSDDDATSPDASAGASWAGGVCSAMTDVESALKDLGQGLEVTLGSGDAADQLKEQVASQVDAVKSSMAALSQSTSDVPADVSSEVSAASADLTSQRDDLQASVDDLESAADDVANADSASSLATAVGAASTALKAATDDASALVSSMQSTASTGADSVKAAFDQAPECSAYTSS